MLPRCSSQASRVVQFQPFDLAVPAQRSVGRNDPAAARPLTIQIEMRASGQRRGRCAGVWCVDACLVQPCRAVPCRAGVMAVAAPGPSVSDDAPLHQAMSCLRRREGASRCRCCLSALACLLRTICINQDRMIACPSTAIVRELHCRVRRRVAPRAGESDVHRFSGRCGWYVSFSKAIRRADMDTACGAQNCSDKVACQFHHASLHAFFQHPDRLRGTPCRLRTSACRCHHRTHRFAQSRSDNVAGNAGICSSNLYRVATLLQPSRIRPAVVTSTVQRFFCVTGHSVQCCHDVMR